MASTKINYYIAVVVVLLIFSFGIFKFGEGLLNSDEVTLSNSSEEYLTTYGALLEDTGISNAVNNPDFDANATNPLTGSEGSSVVQDVFAVFNRIINILEAPYNFIKLIYNMPSFIVEGIGLDIEEWGWIINIVIWAMVIGILITLVRLAK